MEFVSINPWNGEEINRYSEHSEAETEKRLQKASDQFEKWRTLSIDERGVLVSQLADRLDERQDQIARTMTLEMGKPVQQSRAELEKCALLCRHYVNHAADYLSTDVVESDAALSLVRYDPLGTVFGIMPWNFPVWQVFRYAIPSLMAGNTILLKHAPNVFGCAIEVEALFEAAGFPEGAFQNLIIHHDRAEQIISSDVVKAVTLTGSERAGRSVAALAGSELKKSVLELGGNNAFIVLEDADMDKAVETAVQARMMNSGQSCIAAKRFILVGDRTYDQFTEAYIDGVKPYVKADPMSEGALLGPLAREDLAENLQRQMKESQEKGAKRLWGGSRNGAFHEATVLGDVEPGMPAFEEETFGPLASLVRAANEDEAFDLADQSRYGLGMTVFTSDPDRMLDRAGQVSDGAFFINNLVKSDPRLPFGGTRNSGYGRELARDGILEFVNRKTVWLDR
ncbi:MAG: NAD-dependent succinate-semialdehyde dehydrogenase [Balneolaceae bacterium]